jgi:DNA-binding transcriptional MerR regulator
MEANTNRTDGIYSIGAVARMLGVPAQTLRAWEERYQQIVPARSSGGQRLYSRDQVDQLSFIRNQIEQGLQPADAHRLLAQQHSEVANIPVEQRPSTRASVDAATTVLLAERACRRSADRRWRRSGAVPGGTRQRFGAGARRLSG